MTSNSGKKNGKEFRHHQLSNGLVLLAEVNPSVQSSALGFFVKTGARDEQPEESGVSHFLEHMMFKGTQKRNSLDITYALGNIGAQSNAYTSEELTVYYGATVPEHFREFQEILSDMLRPSLDPVEFDTEKKVILEEIALYQDRPHFYLSEHAMRDFYGSHPCGSSVLGTSESITALSQKQMVDYFRRRYVPSNIVLVATGKIDWDTFVSDAEKYCGSWKAGDAARVYPDFYPKKINKEYRKKDLNQTHMLLMSQSPAASDDLRYAYAVLASILGDSSGSRIYWELVDTGLVEGAGADTDDRDGVGCFMASASMAPENFPKVRDILYRILSEPLNFDEADIDRAKTKIAAKVVLGGELPMGRLMGIGNEWQYLKRVTPLRETASKIKAVTREDIEQAYARFPFTNLCEFTLVNDSQA